MNAWNETMLRDNPIPILKIFWETAGFELRVQAPEADSQPTGRHASIYLLTLSNFVLIEQY